MKLKTSKTLFYLFFILICVTQNNVFADDNIVENYTIRAYAPNASSLHISGLGGTWGIPNTEVDMVPVGDSLWEGVVGPVTRGFHYYRLQVNGITSLNPLQNVYGASNSMVNGVEIPDPDSDFYNIQDVPHGTVRMHFYKYVTSKTTTIRRCMVYLPPGYDTKDAQTYPVLYLQHGSGENELSWSQQGEVANIIDNLIADGAAEPMIVVMDNGMTLGYVWLFSHGLQAEIESKFKVNTDKEYRAVAGLSMGGTNAGDLATANQTLFSYLGIFSSFIYINANPQLYKQTNQNFELFWTGYGEIDEYVSDEQLMVTQLNENRINHEAIIYPGGHEWQVWRKCLRDFAPLLFKPYTYTNPFSGISAQETEPMKTYPNPFSDQINIDIPTDRENIDFQIIVADVSGRIIYSGNANGSDLQQKLNEGVKNVPNGVYNLNINSQERNYTSKIVKTY